MSNQPFEDRRQAGQALAAVLRERVVNAAPLHNPLVLALPRGGVPVAHEIAKVLNAPLDILLVRKIGAPGHEEFALGAVVDGIEPKWVVDEEMLKLFAPPPGWFDQQLATQLLEIERRRSLYCGARLPLAMQGRDVILVDDGLATGSTVRAALRALPDHHPRRIILAVPVGAAQTIERLRPQVDALVCLMTPDPFRAVGLHYRNFEQVSDREVIDLLTPA